LRLYEYMSTHGGWWNNDGDGLTYDEFMGYIILLENGGQTDALQYMIEAAGRQLWMNAKISKGHGPYCTSNPCYSGGFNFIGHQSESFWRQYNAKYFPDNGVSHDPLAPRRDVSIFNENASSIGVLLSNPNPNWKIYNGDRPYYWGNKKNWYDKVYKLQLTDSNRFNSDMIVYFKPDDFVISTINQEATWR